MKVKSIPFKHHWLDKELYIEAKAVLEILTYFQKNKNIVKADLKKFRELLNMPDPLKGIWK